MWSMSEFQLEIDFNWRPNQSWMTSPMANYNVIHRWLLLVTQALASPAESPCKLKIWFSKHHQLTPTVTADLSELSQIETFDRTKTSIAGVDCAQRFWAENRCQRWCKCWFFRRKADCALSQAHLRDQREVSLFPSNLRRSKKSRYKSLQNRLSRQASNDLWRVKRDWRYWLN